METESQKTGLPKANILMVDDTPKNLQVLGNMLKNETYNVEFAMSGRAALEWIQKRDFDLILLDVMMPEMDGFEVCAEIKSNPLRSEIPIIFITAKTDTESIVKGFELGAVDYIAKPFLKDELLARVKTQLEIKRSRDEISMHLEEIKSKNNLITSSIQYARLIQEVLLKAYQNESDFFPEYFCLFLPKDIVSGDFYWMHRIDNRILVGVFDCTGHGVPGAFMSMLGITFLNETVIREGITEPHFILNRLREKIIEALCQKGISNELHDGMDGSIISYDLNSKKIYYSGAFNLMCLIRDNEIIEFKGDKMPIGYYEKMSDFSCQEIMIKPNDLIYLFTDGYADQFGGKDDKKFKRAQLKKVLLNNHKNPLEVQNQILLDTYLTWKGNKDQVDDITILGLKL